MGRVKNFFSGEEGVVERTWHGRGKIFSLARRATTERTWHGKGNNFSFSGEEGDDGTHVAWEG